MTEAIAKENLESNKTIQELFDLLAADGQGRQAIDLSCAAWYLDGLARQFDAMSLELQSAKAELQEAQTELAQVSQQQETVIQKSHSVLNALETRLDQLKEQVSAARDKLVNFAQIAVKNIKQSGITTLDKAATALNLRETLEDIQSGVQKSVGKMRDAISRAEEMGAELRSAGNHIKNAGRAAVGKEVKAVESSEEGRFQTIVLAPMRGLHKTLSGINNTTLAAISAVERLEQAAETERPQHLNRKPSIRQKLSEKKEKAVDKIAPAPDKEKKPAEAAL